MTDIERGAIESELKMIVAKEKYLNWKTGFTIGFDQETGFSPELNATVRRLSHMEGMFLDIKKTRELIEAEDPVLYRFYELGAPEEPGELAFGTTILYPGKVGNEYYMTKGHFHTILDTAEVYYTFSGKGYMLMENVEGDVQLQPLNPGYAVYVPRGYAHRVINTGSVPLVFYFTFQADAGHDYKTIETKGYHKVLMERDGIPELMDNPRWK